MDLPKAERLFAYSVLALVAIPSLLCMATARDAWPYSSYRMYSRLYDDSAVTISMQGVTMGGDEFPINEYKYIRPLDVSKVSFGFRRMKHFPNADHHLSEAAAYVFWNYERLRAVGGHDGPPLIGMRVYHRIWKMCPDASNRNEPDQSTLLATYDPSAR